MGLDDRLKMRDRYDEFGEGEWDRLDKDPVGRAAFEIHRRFLNRFVKAGDHVLEVGAGPGRFTFELATIGAVIDVTDFSPVQLDLHQHHLEGTKAESTVKSRALLDICDTSRYDDDTFDVVLAYGGPLSYAFEQADEAFKGLLRITKPGGVVMGSVMSNMGAWRHFFPGVLNDVRRIGWEAVEGAFDTGDLRIIQTSHICQMFTSRELHELIESSGAEILAMSASNWASLTYEEVIAEVASDDNDWAHFMNLEEKACLEPGALDGGTHLLFAAQKA